MPGVELSTSQVVEVYWTYAASKVQQAFGIEAAQALLRSQTESRKQALPCYSPSTIYPMTPVHSKNLGIAPSRFPRRLKTSPGGVLPGVMILRSVQIAASACILWSLLGPFQPALTAPEKDFLEAPHFLLDSFASAATALQMFSGVVSVTTSDSTFLKAYGAEVLESGAPLQKDAILPVASNTKLFSAVAIHQICEQGIMAWEDPVSKYVSISSSSFPQVGNSGTHTALHITMHALACIGP